MATKQGIKIKSYIDDIVLRTIEKQDIELIRKWKNNNRKYFFHKKIISTEQQIEWYHSYLSNTEDYIFLIGYERFNVGCIAFRLIDNFIDIYNVILGNKEFGGRGIMGRALRLLCSYIIDKYNNRITVKVLENNYNALEWYKKNGFIEKSKKEDYVFMELDFNNFTYKEYKIKTF